MILPHTTSETLIEEPWAADGPPAVKLIRLRPTVIDALARMDLASAARLSLVELSSYLVESGPVRTWRYRSKQIAMSPGDASWITRIICSRSQSGVNSPVLDHCVGLAGFHGPPDDRGMVEVGYAIDPQFRRQGFARSALTAMIAKAQSEPAVKFVRASIRPDNLPSRALVAQFNFVEVGELLDDEDGMEMLFELHVGQESRAHAINGSSR